MKDINIFSKIDRKVNRITFLDKRFNEAQDQPGTWLPGATTILQVAPKNSAYYEWLKKFGSDSDVIMAEAMEKGSTVHKLTEDYDNGVEVSVVDEVGNPKYSSAEWEMFMKYVEFSEKHKPEILLNETTYCLASLGYGGTLDRVSILNGETWLIDIKTGNLYEYYWMQLAAYKQLFEASQDKIKIDRIGILHLNAKTRGEDKKGKSIQGYGWSLDSIEQWTDSKTPYEYFLRLFNNCKEMWNWQNPKWTASNKMFQLSVKKDVQPKELMQ